MNRRGLSIRAGLAAPPIAVGGVLLATILDPAVGWWDGTLSNVGEVPPTAEPGLLAHPEALLFNWSLLVAGLLGVPFGLLCYRAARHPLQRSGAVAFVLAFLGLAATGFLAQPSQFHVPALVVHVLATTSALWIYGAGAVNAGRHEFGGASIVLGLCLVGLWLAWELVIGAPGTAIPVFAGILVLSAWTFAEAAGAYEATEGRCVREGVRRAVESVTSGPAD